MFIFSLENEQKFHTGQYPKSKTSIEYLIVKTCTECTIMYVLTSSFIRKRVFTKNIKVAIAV